MKRTNIIYVNEMIENKDKHQFANKHYYLVYVVDDLGVSVPALFTEHEVNKAIARASKNPEDCPPRKRTSSWKRFLAKVLRLNA